MKQFLITKAKKTITQDHIKQLHAQIILNTLHQNSFYISTLITQCTLLKAPPSYTSLIFTSVHHKTGYLYSCMLKYFSQMGLNQEVLSLSRDMLRDGMSPEGFVYPIVIKSAERGFVMLHAHVLKMGFGCDRIVCNAIMDMYGKCGLVEVAKKMFDEMPEKSVVDWNCMISGLWRKGLEVEARELFERMSESERNVVTWTCMVSGYARMKDVETARWFFDEMPEKSVASWNAMMSGYAKNGCKDEALRLFEAMLDGNVRPNETTWAIIISCCSSSGDESLAERLVQMLDEEEVEVNPYIQTALIDMYAKCGKLEAARDVFRRMQVRGNSAAWNAMISAYARAGDLTSAEDLFDKMLVKDIVSWNSMIAGYAQNGQSPQAIELFKQMISIDHPKPDEVTVVSVLSACGHIGALELGSSIVNQLSQTRMKLSISGYNSLIFMYSKCGNMGDAMKTFQKMDVRDVVSYNTIIAGLAAHGNASEAIELIPKMKEEGIKPDRVTFIGVLTACSHAGLLEEGRKIFESISSPSVDHYACMVDLLGRVGDLDEALRLVESMPMSPHSGIYGCLLNASRIHKKVEIGELVASKLFDVEPNNAGNYVLMSNLYAVEGRWKDVKRIRDIMNERGVTKKSGWSFIEYDGKIHKFTAGDRSHERTEDIYRGLSQLRRKMRQAGYFADKSCVLTDIEEEEKEEMIGVHSEKLAISFALLVSRPGSVIRVVKNLRVCVDCHTSIKIISKLEGREITVRDNNRFHNFKDGVCSCNDHW